MPYTEEELSRKPVGPAGIPRAVEAKIAFTTVFTCHRCGKSKAGSNSSQVTVRSISQLKRMLERGVTPGPQSQPIGWSSHYHPDGIMYFCEECAK